VKGIAPDGCPDPDPDDDALLGDADQCPQKAETLNGFEDSDGCPDEIPEELKQLMGVLKDVQFKKGTADLEEKSLPTLDSVVEILKKHPSVRILVSGHTERVGAEERNLELSRERASTVRKYLIDKGIGKERLVAQGAGSSEPIGDNGTRAGREENRRIELKVVSPR
jgi:outer membrane protein OmpA-like peptidoglycan-associated protein